MQQCWIKKCQIPFKKPCKGDPPPCVNFEKVNTGIK